MVAGRTPRTDDMRHLAAGRTLLAPLVVKLATGSFHPLINYKGL